MEYSLMIDQLALRRWYGKIDATDAFVISFIAKLNAHNPRVEKLMRDGYFLITRRWIVNELPILGLSEDTLGRRLAELKRIGLVDLRHTRDAGGHVRLYGRMSKTWYLESEKAKKEVETLPKPYGEISPMGKYPLWENPSYGAPSCGAAVPIQAGSSPTYHKNEDQREENDHNKSRTPSDDYSHPPEEPPPVPENGGGSFEKDAGDIADDTASVDEMLKRQAANGKSFALEILRRRGRRSQKPASELVAAASTPGAAHAISDDEIF